MPKKKEIGKATWQRLRWMRDILWLSLEDPISGMVNLEEKPLWILWTKTFVIDMSTYTILWDASIVNWGFQGGANGKEPACQCRKCKRCRFNPGMGKIPWRTKWQHILVVFPVKFHGQRSLAGYSPKGCKELDTTEHTHTHTHTHTHIQCSSYLKWGTLTSWRWWVNWSLQQNLEVRHIQM